MCVHSHLEEEEGVVQPVWSSAITRNTDRALGVRLASTRAARLPTSLATLPEMACGMWAVSSA